MFHKEEGEFASAGDRGSPANVLNHRTLSMPFSNRTKDKFLLLSLGILIATGRTLSEKRSETFTYMLLRSNSEAVLQKIYQQKPAVSVSPRAPGEVH